jgi:formate dehydrogenase
MRKPSKTYCRVCEAACGLELEYGPDGQPYRLRPDKDHPVSRGFACAKGTRFLETARHPKRLLYPLRRSADGTLHRISWDEATRDAGGHIRKTIEAHGTHAVGIYFGNPIAFNALGAVALPLLMKGLGTRNVYSAGTQDCNNKFAVGTVLHGSPMIHPIPDVEHADLLLMFGTNPAISQSSFVHLAGASTAFDRAAARGAKMFWIDPRRTESAKRWGEHVAIRPGTDVFLLLSLLDQLRDLYRDDPYQTGLDQLLKFAEKYPPEIAAELTGVAAGQIRSLAEQIRLSKATAFHLSVGVNQSGNGQFAYVLVQALAYLSGNYDKRGGVLVHPLAPPMADVARRLQIGTRTVYSRVGGYPSNLDTLPGGILADEILTEGAEKVRTLLVVAGDPMRTMPDVNRLRQAFRSLEKLIVIDLFESDTAREAHLLLPAKSWLERFDFATTTLTFQHAPLFQFAGAVLEAPGETRSEARILSDIAREIGGRTGLLLRPLGWMAQAESFGMLQKLAAFLGVAGNPFGGRSKYGVTVPTPKPGKYLGRGPRTADRKIHFWDDAFLPAWRRVEESASQAALGDGEFVLMGRRRRLGHNGWLQGGVHDGDPEAVAWLNPEDAADLQLPLGGGLVRITNQAGSLEIRAVVAEGIPQKTIVVPHGIPGINFNVLVPTGDAAIDYLSGMHQMTAIPVKVEVLAASPSVVSLGE